MIQCEDDSVVDDMNKDLSHTLTCYTTHNTQTSLMFKPLHGHCTVSYEMFAISEIDSNYQFAAVLSLDNGKITPFLSSLFLKDKYTDTL